MTILTIDEALRLLLQEYPSLADIQPKIVKQFQTNAGRTFNTFLVTTNKSGLERFVAKGVVHKQYGLELEWKILNILQEKHADAPKLLFPSHKPKQFMLIEYIDGLNAAEAMDINHDADDIFTKVGTATGKLHTIEVQNFGDILVSEKKDWSKYLHDKITERLEGVKELISADLYDHAKVLFSQLAPIIGIEATEKPRLIHRDIYLENFLLPQDSDDAILIDYDMAIGGKPFYDLGKFYILELYKLPDKRDVFLDAYNKYISIPTDFNERMKLYILKESLGMINFFNTINDENAKSHAILVLNELTENKGIIGRLVNE